MLHLSPRPHGVSPRPRPPRKTTPHWNTSEPRHAFSQRCSRPLHRRRPSRKLVVRRSSLVDVRAKRPTASTAPQHPQHHASVESNLRPFSFAEFTPRPKRPPPPH
eukprot:scaffold613_cov79-Phaeocystis_antarctica.AAC.15